MCGPQPSATPPRRRCPGAAPGACVTPAPPAGLFRRRCRTTPGWPSKSARSSSRRSRRGARAVRRPRRHAPAARRADCLSVSARRRRSGRSRPGRFRQGLQAHRLVSRGVALRGLVHADSHQRLPRSPEGPRPARPLDRARPTTPKTSPHDRRAAAGTFGSRVGRRNPEARLLARERRARMTAAIDRSKAGSARCSCCATTATARRAKSAR